MTQTAELAATQFDWPREIAKRSIDRQHQAFDASKPTTRALLAPRIERHLLWLGDATLLHDLGWWWLTTLRLGRTAVSIGLETVEDLFTNMEMFNELAEEAFAPVETKLVNAYQARLYIERLYCSMNPGERAFAASRGLPELIRKLEHDLTTFAIVDLQHIHEEAVEHIRHGTFASNPEDSVVQKLATSAVELLSLLSKERERADALRRFMPDADPTPASSREPETKN